jgi:hypothetical protein
MSPIHQKLQFLCPSRPIIQKCQIPAGRMLPRDRLSTPGRSFRIALAAFILRSHRTRIAPHHPAPGSPPRIAPRSHLRSPRIAPVAFHLPSAAPSHPGSRSAVPGSPPRRAAPGSPPFHPPHPHRHLIHHLHHLLHLLKLL